MWNIEKVVKKGNYLYAVVKNHPNRTKNNYVLLHRVIMENHIGRLLNENEIVHHRDKNKLNNSISNLEVMSVKSHASKHRKEHGRKWALLKCPWCESVFEKEYNQTFVFKNASYTCCSAKCRGKLSRTIQLNGMNENLERRISENLINVFVKYS